MRDNNSVSKTTIVLDELKKWGKDGHPFILKITVVPAVVALIEKIIMHPVDTLLTFQQKEKMRPKQAVKHIYNRYGSGGFYRGLTLPVLLSAPLGGVAVYGAYAALKDKLPQYTSFTKTQNFLLSAGLTGIFLSLLSTPIEAGRVRATFGIQATSKKYLNYYYRGFVPNTIKLAVSAMVMLGGTDVAKDQLERKKLSKPDDSSSVFFLGLGMGLVGQIISTPIDVIKTKVMEDASARHTLFQHARQAFHERNIFTGLSTRIIRFGCQPAIMLGLMHVFNKMIDQNNLHVSEENDHDASNELNKRNTIHEKRKCG